MNAADTNHINVTCPNCKTDEHLTEGQRMLATCFPTTWKRGADGLPEPDDYNGETEAHWDTMAPLETGRYFCRGCDKELDPADLLVDGFPAKPPRAAPEALTIAYVAIGAHEAWRAASEAQREAVADGYGGQLGFIDACTGHALLLDRAWDAAAGDGVTFAYDVAEPFGEALAKALLAGGIDPAIPYPDPATIIADLIGGVDLATIRSLA